MEVLRQWKTHRLLGLDYGSKTVGVAVSDPLFLTSQPLETIVRERENKLRRTLARIEAIAAETGAAAIVLGLPLNMDDTEGERAAKTREFARQLTERIGLPVLFQDERLTTEAAAEILDDSGVARAEQKRFIDAVAAALILEDYMNTIKQEHREETVVITDPETGEADTLYVVEQTKVGGKTYLLLAEDDSEESEAWIFRTENWEEEEPSFVPVEDDEEYEAVARIFEQLLEDTELLMN